MASNKIVKKATDTAPVESTAKSTAERAAESTAESAPTTPTTPTATAAEGAAAVAAIHANDKTPESVYAAAVQLGITTVAAPDVFAHTMQSIGMTFRPQDYIRMVSAAIREAQNAAKARDFAPAVVDLIQQDDIRAQIRQIEYQIGNLRRNLLGHSSMAGADASLLRVSVDITALTVTYTGVRTRETIARPKLDYLGTLLVNGGIKDLYVKPAKDAETVRIPLKSVEGRGVYHDGTAWKDFGTYRTHVKNLVKNARSAGGSGAVNLYEYTRVDSDGKTLDAWLTENWEGENAQETDKPV